MPTPDNSAYIYDHVRTPRGKGKKDGSLHQFTALDLSAQVLSNLRDRSNLDTTLVDDVSWGCVTPVGEQGGDIARAAVLAANYDQYTAGAQVNRFCASGLEAVNIAAAKVVSGEATMAIGGGVECMSRVPMGSDGGAWAIDVRGAFPQYFVPQGVSADMIASKWGFSRTDCDAYAVESHKRAAQSWAEGRFKNAVIKVKDQMGVTALDHDESIRPGTDMQTLGGLNPSFAMMGEMAFDAVINQRYPEVERVNHVHTPGNSSSIVDGAAAVLVGSKEAGVITGMKAKARIVGTASIGSEPSIMLTGPSYVTEKLLKKLGMKVSDIDLYELNEAFAAVVLRYMQALDIPHDKINVCGGAIAMGHPLGATGAMILGTLVDELERSGKSTGLAVLCVGGGMATAAVVERV
ncbi:MULTISPECIES: acetyl-CoA C-acetyltransferase [Asticcacaulis]|uniref:acetyl-CoA C-acetyltransferase n=1 Tax=Asticcacaulis TaxID=76890 RepID=UPI001AE62BEF|nr:MULTISPECIES: acetyl-CoA C-acetyltransferase [Asticcacaulis]MBP2161859.1 acetyl-CoA C-acetyltransferase [Asticcacaulis solisilvae]MDR6802899.1 acetyl-CoA C-acetyltransferase [Asticcacaulis sp. BE141]